MEYLSLIATILLIHILAWFTPGPQVALIIRNSLIYSHRTGFFTALGFATGNLFHICFAVAGLGVIFSASTVFSILIKYFGIGYLIYLGINTFFSTTKIDRTSSERKKNDLPIFSAFKTGLLLNILNPQAYTFFLTLFSTVMASNYPGGITLVLLVVMPLNTLIMASLWSLLFTRKIVSSLYLRFQSLFNKLLGGLLVFFALIILLADK